MSKAEEIRGRIKTAEVSLPSGNEYLVRRPGLRALARVGQLTLPGAATEAPQPPIAEAKPESVKIAEVRRGYEQGEAFTEFMIDQTVETWDSNKPPKVVSDEEWDNTREACLGGAGTVPDWPHYQATHVRVSDVAGDEVDFYIAVVNAFFGAELAQAKPFRPDVGGAPVEGGA